MNLTKEDISQIEKDLESFRERLKDLEAGKLKPGSLINVLSKPSVAWLKAGLPEKRIVLPENVYKKATVAKHQIDKSTMENFPELISQPAFIFESATQDGSFVGILNAVDKENRPILVAIKPSGGALKLNLITSSYGRNNAESFIEQQIQDGRLLYDSKNPDSYRPHKATIAKGSMNPDIYSITYITEDFNTN